MLKMYQAAINHANAYASILTAISTEFSGGEKRAIRALKQFDQERPQIDLALTWLSRCNPTLETDQLIIRYINSIIRFKNLKYKNYRDRISHLEMGIDAAQRISDTRLVATFYQYLGDVYHDMDEHEQSIYAYQRQLSIAREISDVELEIIALQHLGPVKTYIGDLDQAIEYLNSSLDLSKAHNLTTGQTTIYGSLGLAYQAKGNLIQAVSYFRTQLEIAIESTDINLKIESIINLGGALAYKGELQEATAISTQGLKMANKFTDYHSRALLYSILGYCFLKLEKYHTSILYYSKQLKIFKETRNMLRSAICLGNLGEAYALIGDIKTAEDIIQESLLSPERTKTQRWNMYILNRYANVLREQGAFEEPKSLYEEVIAFNTQSGERDYVAQAEIDYARLLQRHGFAQEALAHATSAMEIYRSCGADFFADQIGVWIAKNNLAGAPGELR